MAFVKLDVGILTSSLWANRAQRDVFITALLMAVPVELDVPMPALKVRAIEPSGFVVPPGEYGFISAAAPGIVRMALMDEHEGMAALEALCEPDEHSRTTDFDGRRLARVDRGYVVLNYMTYRDKDHTARDRMRRYRQRKGVTRNGDGPTRNVTQAEAEAEAEGRKKKARANAQVLISIDALQAEGIEEEVAAAWMQVRKDKRAGALTAIAWKGLQREAAKAGWTVHDAVRKCVERSWITFSEHYVSGERPPRSPDGAPPEWEKHAI